MAAPTTIDEFLDLIRKSGIVDGQRLEAHVDQIRNSSIMPTTPDQLAKTMIDSGLLTKFQARQLLLGKHRAFTISGKYKVLEPLAAGGMGRVYLCEHIIMHRRVAIKVLPPDKSQDQASLERFQREARAVAKLDHPNIVRAHDIDHDGSLHFLVMEYVDGASLHDIVKRKGPMDPVRAAHYISQAALGLQHAHESGLVHRDIKPGNLLVDRGGTVKVLDLGLARFFYDRSDNITAKHDEGILGTADYLAPEQTIGSDVDIRADIYSLGLTFYFLLAGCGPFDDGSVAQKLIWQQVRQPKPIRSLRPGVAEGMAVVLEKMISKDAEARYQTPAEVVEALRPWTQDAILPPSAEEMPTLCRAAGGSDVSEGGPASPGPLSPRVQATARTKPSKPGLSSNVINPPTFRPGTAAPLTPQRRSTLENVGASAQDVTVTKIVGRPKGELPVDVVKRVPAIKTKPVQGSPETENARAQADTGLENPERSASKKQRLELVPATSKRRRILWIAAFASVLSVAIVAIFLWASFFGPAKKGAEMADHSLEAVVRQGEAPQIAAPTTGDQKETPAPAVAETLSAAKPKESSVEQPEDVGEVRRFLGQDSVARVAFSPDGRYILAGSNSAATVPMWEVSSGREVQRFTGHNDVVYDVAFSPDGRRAITGSFDRTARIWDVTTGKELCRFSGHTDKVYAVAYFPDGGRALSAGPEKLARIWNTKTAKELHVLKGHTMPIHHLAISLDGRLALTASHDGTARVWDTTSGAEKCRLEGHASNIYGVAFSPDGNYTLTGGEDRTMRLWNIATAKELRRFVGHEHRVTCVAFSPGGHYALSSSYDQTVRLWDISNSRLLHTFEGHRGGVIGVAFSPDGRYALSGSDDSTVRLWQLPKASMDPRLSPLPQPLVPSTSSSPESKLVITLPTTRQIVQRDEKNQGRVTIEGSTEEKITSIEARMVPVSGASGAGPPWRLIAEKADIQGDTFNGVLEGVPGGWYVLQVRALKNDKVVAETKVEKVGIGEVLVTAGQSNAANYGQTRQTPREDCVSAWDGREWHFASDPQPLVPGTGGTPWPVLGDKLVEKLGVPVGFVSLAVGGTTVQQWQPGGRLYEQLKRALVGFGKNGARCVLWHQGESDTAAGTSATEYARLMNNIIKQSRIDARYEIKWFVAGASFIGAEHRAKEAAVRAGQQIVCDGKMTFPGPVTDNLHGDYRMSDTVHFSDKGLKEHGRLWADILLKTLFEKIR